MGRVKRFGVSIDEELCRRFDRHIAEKGYSNRSEALRDLIREHLVSEQWKLDGMESVASLSLVYNHHTRELSETLNALQHQHHELVVSSLHVHIDHDNCLEVIIFKGPNTLIKSIADRLIATRGVKHGKLTMSTTGHGF